MSTATQSRKTLFVSLTALCTLAYFVSYISRINLSAAMVEMIATGFAPKTTVALALSINSITYGAGQVISGYLGDRYKPQNVVLGGFVLAGAMNLGVAFLKNAQLLIPLWAINGFAQALMWPPLVRILTQHFSGDEYTIACKWVGWGGAFGTMAVYAGAPILLSISGYHAIFLTSGVVALAMSVVWKTIYERRFARTAAPVVIKKEAPAATAVQTGRPDAIALFLMGMVMIGIVMQGALRDGVSNWMPTLVSESFGLDSSSAILSGVLLPIFHILCSQLTSWIYRRVIRNELLCSGTIFAVSVLVTVLLALQSGENVMVSVMLIAMLVGCMHGVNFIFTCMVPPHFARYGRISLVSGVLNASTYVGSALSTYGIAVFSQFFGWNATIWLWAGIAGIGAVICFTLMRQWKTFTGK